MRKLILIVTIVQALLIFIACTDDGTNAVEDNRFYPKVKFIHASPNIDKADITLSLPIVAPAKIQFADFENKILPYITVKGYADKLKSFYTKKTINVPIPNTDQTMEDDYYIMNNSVTTREKDEILEILNSLEKKPPVKLTSSIFKTQILGRLLNDLDKEYLLGFYTESSGDYILKDFVDTSDKERIIKILEAVQYYVAFKTRIDLVYFDKVSFEDCVSYYDKEFPEGNFGPIKIYQHNPTMLIDFIEKFDMVKGKNYSIVLYGTKDEVTSKNLQVTIFNYDDYNRAPSNKSRIRIFNAIPDLDYEINLEITRREDVLKISNIGYGEPNPYSEPISMGTIPAGGLKVISEVNGVDKTIYTSSSDINLEGTKNYTFVFKGYYNPLIDNDNIDKNIELKIINDN